MPNDTLRDSSREDAQEASSHASKPEVPMQTRRREREPSPKAKASGTTKLFVLDTNVLMHDPTSLFRFEEHDVYLPMVTLEELDSNKKGMSEVSRNARQASRFLDDIVSKAVDDIAAGIPLETSGAKEATDSGMSTATECVCRKRLPVASPLLLTLSE